MVKYYETERKKMYQSGEPYCDYLERVKVCEGNKFKIQKSVALESIPSIEEYVNGLRENVISIDAMGPYGSGFATLDEIDLYNDMAKELDDKIEFEGSSDGFNAAGGQTFDVVYKNGKLDTNFEFEEEEDF